MPVDGTKRYTSFVAVMVGGVALASIFIAGCEKPGSASSSSGASAATSPKQLWHCGMHPQVIQDHPGTCPICHMDLTPLNAGVSPAKGGKRKVLYWWDPMLGSSSITDHPGKSAMGMERVPVYANQAGPDVHIDPTVVQNMGVRTAQVTRGPLTRTVRTVGFLMLPEPGLHDVSLKVGGWIDKLHADQEGVHVVQGEPLFELYSQELQVAEQELISAVQSRKSLGDKASSELRQEGQSLVDSSKRKLRLWDVADEDIEAIAKADKPPRDVPFRSPATGHVEEKMIVQGSAVQAGMKLMRIADHTRMWLNAQVYQEQLPVVKIGQEVVASVDGIPGKSFKGTINFMYPHVDHMTRTLTVRITLDNPGFELKPGMYATVDILTQPMADAVQVPRETVIDTGTRQIAFVAEGDGHFSPRKVRMGMMGDNDKVQIIEGLAAGETVVTSGQFLMDVESQTIEASQKFTEPRPADSMSMPGAASSRPTAAVSQPSSGNTR